MKKLLLLLTLCALAGALAPGRAAAADPCGRPEGHVNWVDFGWPEFTSVFARPGTLLAVSSGDFPAEIRRAGAITLYWDMYLNKRVGQPAAPEDPAVVLEKANKLYDFASTQTSCAQPWIAENELFGASLVTPWSDSNAQYRANVLAYLQTLAARGARPFLLVNSRPYTGGEAAAWWQQVAAVADIVRETYLNAKTLYAQGPVLANRTLRTAMRSGLEDFLAIGIPPQRLGVMLGFQTTPGHGGREGLRPTQAWLEVVKWQALSAREIAQEIPIATIWSWGWGTWTQPEQDPDKPAAGCVWLWTRAHALCDGPKAAGPGWDASTTEGQINLANGVQCTVAGRRITEYAIAQLQRVTGDREAAFTALFARIAESDAASVSAKQVAAAERAIIAERFGGSAAAYRSALARSGVSVALARGILADELRRQKIGRTLWVPEPSASEIATFYESYPDVLVRAVTAKPAPAWLGGKPKGLALGLLAPESVFDLRAGQHTVRTFDGTYKVTVAGDAQPLGTMPLSAVAPAIRAALTAFARGAAVGSWTVRRQDAYLRRTICQRDDMPVPGSVELETFVPALAAVG